MKQKIKLCAIGVCCGFLPVVLAWLLIRNLWVIAAAVGKLAGLEPALANQITQAVQQLQDAKLVLPWLMGVVLSAASVGVALFAGENKKRRKVLIIVGAVLVLPLTLAAFCLSVVNEIRVWNLISALLPLLKAL